MALTDDKKVGEEVDNVRPPHAPLQRGLGLRLGLRLGLGLGLGSEVWLGVGLGLGLGVGLGVGVGVGVGVGLTCSEARPARSETHLISTLTCNRR